MRSGEEVRGYRKGKDRAACTYAPRQVMNPCGPPVAVVNMRVSLGKTVERSVCARHLADRIFGERSDDGRFIQRSLADIVRRNVEQEFLAAHEPEIADRVQFRIDAEIESAISQLPPAIVAEIRAAALPDDALSDRERS